MDNWRLDHLLSLLKEDDSDEFVRYAIGQEYLKMENYDHAIMYFDALREMNPAYVGLYYHLAAAHRHLDQDDQARSTYNQGIEVAKSLNDQHALSELMNALTNMDYE